MFIQIYFCISQYFFLTQAVDSESSKSESISLTVFFAVIHVFAGYIIYTDHEYEAMFAQHTFMSGVVLPVILGSALRLMVVAIWAKKSATPKPTPTPIHQVNNSPDDAYTLETTVQKLEAYLERIKQQKEQLEANLGQNIQPMITSIEAKLTHLQKRIHQEVGKNEVALGHLMSISSKKSSITRNLNKLEQLQLAKDSFAKEFKAAKPYFFNKSKKYQTTKPNQVSAAKLKKTQPNDFRLNDFLLKEIKKSEDKVHQLVAQLDSLGEDEKLINRTMLVRERKKLVNKVTNKVKSLPDQIQAHIDTQHQLIAKVQKKHPLGKKSPEAKQLRRNLDELNKLHKGCRQFSANFFANQQAAKNANKSGILISDVPISQRLSRIEKKIKALQKDFISLKQTDRSVDDIRQFVEVTPQAIDELNQTIDDCLHDVMITCHPETAKVRNRQLNELSGQLQQFTFDFEGFAKNLNFTKVFDTTQAILPHQQVYNIPELETQAQELWQEYHPESEEVFWELYNELLTKVKETSMW